MNHSIILLVFLTPTKWHLIHDKRKPSLIVLHDDDDSETMVDARRQLNVFLLWVDIGIHSVIRMETRYLENLSKGLFIGWVAEFGKEGR